MAISCSQWEDPDYRGEDETTVSVNPKPDVSAVFVGDSTGVGVVEVTYNFPNANQRHLASFINDAPWTGTQPDTQSGVWKPGLDVSCWPPGSYDIKVVATACNRWGDPLYTEEAHTSIQVDPKPSVSVQVDQSANTISIPYSYPNTRYGSQRHLRVFVDGVLFNTASFNEQSGTHGPLTMPACWKTARTVATACEQFGNPAYTAEAEEQADQLPPSVSVTLLKLGLSPFGDTREIQATVTYDLKMAGGSVEVVLLAWTGADGQVHAGGAAKIMS